MIVGTVKEIWRYPVKSMKGGRLESAAVGTLGIPGDRGWALFDEEAREVRGAKKFPPLLHCSARYLSEPGESGVPIAEITFPDGAKMRSDDPEISRRLSTLVGRKVTLHPIRPREDSEHYRRRLPEDPEQMMRELREVFGRTEDEPIPDISIFPHEILEFTSPRGTYFDAFPLHLLTTAWLAELARSNPGARFDRLRFRPNVLIDAEPSSPRRLEQEWCGRDLRVGSVRVKIEMPVVRCVMTTLPQGDLPKDPSVLRTIVRESDQNVGVYASVTGAGRVNVGDPVELVG